MKKLTAQNLYEAVIENQVPCNEDAEVFFPGTTPEILNLVSDYWSAIDEVTYVRKRIRRLAEEENKLHFNKSQ